MSMEYYGMQVDIVKEPFLKTFPEYQQFMILLKLYKKDLEEFVLVDYYGHTSWKDDMEDEEDEQYEMAVDAYLEFVKAFEKKHGLGIKLIYEREDRTYGEIYGAFWILEESDVWQLSPNALKIREHFYTESYVTV